MYVWGGMSSAKSKATKQMLVKRKSHTGSEADLWGLWSSAIRQAGGFNSTFDYFFSQGYFCGGGLIKLKYIIFRFSCFGNCAKLTSDQLIFFAAGIRGYCHFGLDFTERNHTGHRKRAMG